MADLHQQTYEHHQSNAIGLLDTRFDKDEPLAHFRGIKYASISERFASPVLKSRQYGIKLRATEFGPRCPQIPVDVRDLMQIPKHLETYPADTEDEFECLNLNITLPAKNTAKLPVLIWIYGGAQVVSFSTSAQRLCETGPLVAQSISSKQPIIIVNPNYRVNVFAYGDGSPSCERNLQLQDLETAVRWVFDNISDFGGDTSRITIAGESAGSVFTHALCLTLPSSLPISRAILCSGSLGTSRFQPPSFFAPTLSRIFTTARTHAVQQAHPNAEELTLRTIPTQFLVSSMAANALNSIPLQTPSGMDSNPPLHECFSRLSALMIGDCEFEGILWLAGIRLIPSSSIRALFLGSDGDSDSDSHDAASSAATQRLTSIYLDNPISSTGHAGVGLSHEQATALSFLSDHHFHLPNHEIVHSLAKGAPPPPSPPTTTTPSPKVYTYLFDEPNPFSSAPPPKNSPPDQKPSGVPRAHHAVDLLALFDSYAADYPPASAFVPVANAFRDKVLAFVNGAEPWSPARGPSSAAATATAHHSEQSTSTHADVYAYAFGPQGQHGEITSEQYAERRRTAALAVMREVGPEVVEGVFDRLMGAIAKEIRRALAEMGVQGVPEQVRQVEVEGEGQEPGAKL